MNARLLVAAARGAPFVVVPLFLFMALPSRIIFSQAGAEFYQQWHPGFAGWYDLALLIPLAGWTVAVGGHNIRRIAPFAVTSLAIVVVSILSNDALYQSEALFDGILYWARFIVPFFSIYVLTQKSGTQMGESVAFGMGLILMTTSLFVFQLQYGTYNRLYASGMTVGSFAQVMLGMFAIAMIRSNRLLFICSAFFLMMTFSRTSIILWSLVSLYYYLVISRLSSPARTIQLIIGISLLALSIVYVLQDAEFQHVIEDRTDLESISTFSTRFTVWEYGLELLTRRDVSLTGLGFNCTASALLTFRSPTSIHGVQQYFPTFHSIILEYAIGLGILSIPILVLLVWRTLTFWKSKCYVPFFLYTAFLLSQTFDFTFYRPKEVVIWGVLLGLAEGEWQLQLRSIHEVTKAEQRVVMSAQPITQPPPSRME